MAFKEIKVAKDLIHQSASILVEGQCGGCGTKDNVHEYCCNECAKGYPEPTEEDMAEAEWYARNYL